MARRPKKRLAAISSPTKGVATYRTSTGAFVYFAYWSADPLKDEAWADMVASEEPGGRHSVYFLQQFEADDEAKGGDRIYWAFDRDRNIVEPFDIPKDWPVYLGADFGERAATAIIFVAQDPKSRRVYAFDSIYTPKGLDPVVKETIYKKLCKHFGVTMKEMMLEGADRFIAGAEGDKTAKAFISFYQMEPWPVNFAGRDDLEQHKNKLTALKVNRGLWPSMVCCGVRHMADKAPETDEEPVDPKKCPLCGTERKVEPVAYLVADTCPELEEQLETLVGKEAVFEGQEAPEKEAGAPNHAADGYKYIMRALDWEEAEAPSEDEVQARSMARLAAKHPWERSIEESMLLRAHKAFEADKMAREQRTNRRGVSISKYGGGRAVTLYTPLRPRAQA